MIYMGVKSKCEPTFKKLNLNLKTRKERSKFGWVDYMIPYTTMRINSFKYEISIWPDIIYVYGEQ